MKAKVENEELVRDLTNNAILNTNMAALNTYRQYKNNKKLQQEKINNLESEILKMSKFLESLGYQGN